MRYNIYIHHSTKLNLTKAGFLITDECLNFVEFGYVEKSNQGYGGPLFLAAIESLNRIPKGSFVTFYSACESFTTKKNTKTAKTEKEDFKRISQLYSVSVSKVAENHPGIIELKKKLNPRKNLAEKHIKADGDLCFIPDFIAFTDGSCNNLSPYGEGGAAYIILDSNGNHIKQNSKGFLGVSNNKMELLAILSAVAAVPVGSSLLVRTDSQYCIQVLTNKRNADNFTRPNANVIRQFFTYAGRLKEVRFEWVKGHDGNEYNELVDALAQSRTEEMRTIHNIPVYDWRNSPKCVKLKV